MKRDSKRDDGQTLNKHPTDNEGSKRNTNGNEKKKCNYRCRKNIKRCYIIHCTKKVICFDETNSIKIDNSNTKESLKFLMEVVERVIFF